MTTTANDRAAAVARGLAAASGYVSGEALAREAGVSRAAVRKHVQRLVGGGARVEALAGAGYRLVELPDRPDAAGIAAHRGASGLAPAGRLGHSIDHLREVSSTNDAAIAAARGGAPEGSVVTADVQLGGRGRRGRRWESPAGGLYMSIVLRPDLPPAELTKLGLIGALAVCEALDEVEVRGSSLKWPNDIVAAGPRGPGKLGGVLVEASVDAERVAWAVMGVGINVSGVPAPARDVAVSVGDVAGAPVRRAALAAAVLEALEPMLDELYAGDGPRLLQRVAARCETIGRDVEVVDASGAKRRGRALGLGPDGSLRLLEEAGEVSLSSGDVLIGGGR